MPISLFNCKLASINYILKNLILFFSAILFFSCSKEDKVSCTEEFRFVGVNVEGDSLSDYFTIRQKTSDTIRLEQSVVFPDYIWYIILDDSFSQTLKNSSETFTFQGFINDSIVISEDYVIKADDCHISRQSGLDKINF